MYSFCENIIHIENNILRVCLHLKKKSLNTMLGSEGNPVYDLTTMTSTNLIKTPNVGHTHFSKKSCVFLSLEKSGKMRSIESESKDSTHINISPSVKRKIDFGWDEQRLWRTFKQSDGGQPRSSGTN